VDILADEYYEEKKNLTSDFNQAKLEILRLNNRWESFGTKIRSGDLINANWELDSIWGELVRDEEIQDKDSEEAEKYNTKLRKINELIAKHQDYPDKFYLILRFKERILRRLQDVAGKGGKRSSEDEDDVDT